MLFGNTVILVIVHYAKKKSHLFFSKTSKGQKDRTKGSGKAVPFQLRIPLQGIK